MKMEFSPEIIEKQNENENKNSIWLQICNCAVKWVLIPHEYIKDTSYDRYTCRVPWDKLI